MPGEHQEKQDACVSGAEGAEVCGRTPSGSEVAGYASFEANVKTGFSLIGGRWSILREDCSSLTAY